MMFFITKTLAYICTSALLTTLPAMSALPCVRLCYLDDNFV